MGRGSGGGARTRQAGFRRAGASALLDLLDAAVREAPVADADLLALIAPDPALEAELARLEAALGPDPFDELAAAEPPPLPARGAPVAPTLRPADLADPVAVARAAAAVRFLGPAVPARLRVARLEDLAERLRGALLPAPVARPATPARLAVPPLAPAAFTRAPDAPPAGRVEQAVRVAAVLVEAAGLRPPGPLPPVYVAPVAGPDLVGSHCAGVGIFFSPEVADALADFDGRVRSAEEFAALQTIVHELVHEDGVPLRSDVHPAGLGYLQVKEEGCTQLLALALTDRAFGWALAPAERAAALRAEAELYGDETRLVALLGLLAAGGDRVRALDWVAAYHEAQGAAAGALEAAARAALPADVDAQVQAAVADWPPPRPGLLGALGHLVSADDADDPRLAGLRPIWRQLVGTAARLSAPDDRSGYFDAVAYLLGLDATTRPPDEIPAPVPAAVRPEPRRAPGRAGGPGRRAPRAGAGRSG